MLNPSFRDLAEKGDSRYTLAILIAKRARRIVDGSKPLVETKSKKPVSIALEEVLSGEISYERREGLEEEE